MLYPRFGLTGPSLPGGGGSGGSKAERVKLFCRRSHCAITRITSCAKYGVSWTSTQKCRAGISMTETAVAATAVNDRGSSSISAISPNSPGALTVWHRTPLR
jgi:hypothetical protein